jgi:hypothetical protein
MNRPEDARLLEDILWPLLVHAEACLVLLRRGRGVRDRRCRCHPRARRSGGTPPTEQQLARLLLRIFSEDDDPDEEGRPDKGS